MTTKEAGSYTIGALLAEGASMYPDNPAFVFQNTDKNQTYGMLNIIADQVAKALIAYIGDRPSQAAIWAPNVAEWPSILFGAARAGIPLVLVNTNVKALELEYILKQSDCRLLFVIGPGDQPLSPIPILREVCPELVRETFVPLSSLLLDLEYLVFLGDGPESGMMAFHQFLKSGESISDTALRLRTGKVSPQEIFTIQYTSGTTEKPKGAMLSHAAYSINGFAIARRKGLIPSDLSCIPLPFFHGYGCISMIAAIAVGSSVAPVERFNPVTFLQIIESSQASMVCGTPTMFIAALDELERTGYNLSSLKGENMAGSPCPPELVRRVCTHMGTSELGVLYGSTEASIIMEKRPFPLSV